MKADETTENVQNYSAAYSEKSFWEKLARFALTAGKEIVGKALTLYFCFQDNDTPKWAKAVILGALGYFIAPLDAIPDPVPLVGFADDLGVIVFAFSRILIHIKDSHRKMADEKLKEWFPN